MPAIEDRRARKTKIICTIGPATATKDMLYQLAMAGMNIARINMSHGDHEFHRKIIRTIKSLNKDELHKHPISILLDTQGPEIRTGDVLNDLHLNVGETFTFHIIPGMEAEAQSVFVNYRDIVKDLKVKLAETCKVVADHLRNTVAVCRSYYIHPTVFKTYENAH